MVTQGKTTNIQFCLSSTFVCSGSPLRRADTAVLTARFFFSAGQAGGDQAGLQSSGHWYVLRIPTFLRLLWSAWAKDAVIHLSLLQTKTKLTFHWSNMDTYRPFFIISLPSLPWVDSLLNVGSACVCFVFLLSVLIELGALSVRSIQGKHVSLCTGRQSVNEKDEQFG